MSGTELKKNIISSLYSEDSDASYLVQLSSVLKDVDLTEQEINTVVEKSLEILPSIEYIDLPSFVYQLLLISTKGKCRQALQSIMSYFVEKDKQMRNMLHADSEDLIDNRGHVQYRQTEGTVILMISVICRHNQSIGKEFILFLKKIYHKPQYVLSPVIFSTALALSKIHRNSDEIFDILKKTLLAAFQLIEKRQNSVWFRSVIKWDEDVLKLVKEAVKCSKFGWDHVCQGLVKFGFITLDAFGPRYIVGNAVKAICPEACELGSHILKDTFKCHRVVRQPILEQILNRIITKTQKPITHYIDILSQIVQSDPHFLLEVLPKLIEVLDYLHFLPHSSAASILQSLAPLLRISAPLKDTLMLVLRKALFHKDIEARKVAVCGYLTLLKKLNFFGKVSLSQSQTSVGSYPSSTSMISSQVKAHVYVSGSSNTSKNMCLEIMGLLRRALMQQNEVKQLLYEGLYDVVLHNPSLKDIVLELLLSQFETYYNSDEHEIPLHFSLCFQQQKNEMVLKEPFAHLITSAYLILFLGQNDEMDEDYNQSPQKMLGTFLQNLMKRMIDADVTEFHIAKDADLDESDSEYHLKTSLLLNIYESLIEYSFLCNSEFKKEGCEELLKLYQKYKQIFDSISKKKQSKATKSKTGSSLQLLSHTTQDFISKVMEALFLNETFKHQVGLQVFREDSDFVINIVTSCNQRFTKMCETGKVSDGFSQVMELSFDHLTVIGKALLKTYCDGLSSDFENLEWSKLSCLFAEGLSITFNYASTFHRKHINKFIINICREDSLSASDAMHHILKDVQKSIMKLLSNTDDDTNLKECIPLLSVIKVLYSLFISDFKNEVYVWIKELCSQQVFQNISISKAFLSLCFTLGHQDENILGYLKEIAFDIRYHLGNIDPDETVTGPPKNEIITSDAVRNLFPILFSNLEHIFDELEWVLNFMNVNILGGKDFFEASESYRRLSVEQSICFRVSELIFICYEIVQTGVFETIGNAILKLVTRLYKLLTALTKHYLLLHKNKVSQLHLAFEKLVKLSNTKLTTQVYAFITFIQMLSGEEGDKKKKAKSNVSATKAAQEMKVIPSLVFEIESYEKNLIIISKKYKKDLTNKMKASTSRDFRINAAMLTTVMEQQENSLADTTTDDRTENNDSLPNSPHNSPVKEDSDNTSVHESSENENEAPKEDNEPIDVSQNIFGENVPPNTVPTVLDKVQPGNKRKRLGIRMNARKKL